MKDRINEILRIFEAPFEVEPTDELGWMANFLDGTRQVVDRRLSVGERVVLSMAFRVVLNSIFAGGVGLLIMDEPTADLDEHNLACLPQALDKLRSLSAEQGLQVLFVTHAQVIRKYFDNVIEITA
jgi:DNA repair exonuclease SbcCD ATPase subunit